MRFLRAGPVPYDAPGFEATGLTRPAECPFLIAFILFLSLSLKIPFGRESGYIVLAQPSLRWALGRRKS
jgi:hypothetical protein